MCRLGSLCATCIQRLSIQIYLRTRKLFINEPISVWQQFINGHNEQLNFPFANWFLLLHFNLQAQHTPHNKVDEITMK